jgi:hypothetical protein
MRPRVALRRAVRYHLRASVPTAVGAGIAGAGLWYGLLGGTGTTLSPAGVVASGRAVPAVLLVCLGVVVAAVGRTAVRLATTADVVAAEVEAARADEDGFDADDVRETVSLAVEHAVADAMDAASDDLTGTVGAAVSRALSESIDDTRAAGSVADAAAESVGAGRGDRVRREGDWVDDSLLRGGSSDDPGDRDDASARWAPEDAAAPDRRAADVGASDPLADAAQLADERVESLLDREVGEFPAEPSPPTDDAEILTDSDDAPFPDGAAADHAEILDADEGRDGGGHAVEAVDEEANEVRDGDADADDEMVFGENLRDAE